ncbi:hypothetical protein IWX47DRAFT_865678 [Phyllosticta citricarpa]
MQSRTLALTAAASLLSLAFAHGDEAHTADMPAMDMNMNMAADAAPKHAEEAFTAPGKEGWPLSYWSYSENVGLLYTYMALVLLNWIIIAPPVVMLSVARSRFALPAQFLFLASQGVALFTAIIYDAKTPDLYPNNAHYKVRWIVFWISAVWVALGLVNLYADWTNRSKTQPLSTALMAQYQRLQQAQQTPPNRMSYDSGQGTERNSGSLFGHSLSPCAESEDRRHFHDAHDDDYEAAAFDDADNVEEKRGFLRNTRVDRFMSRVVPRIGDRPLKIMRFFYVLVERLILVLGFVSVATLTTTVGGISRGNHIFNILAHYIKGAIFFWYGLLTLGRWMGSFADFGWAWNVKPPQELVGRAKTRIPTAEFTESFVICAYGASNVFLEHLAAWGGEWTAQDLEHVSISVMFFGGGALGMLIESKKVRELLNTSILSTRNNILHADEDHFEQPKSYSVSLNPMPAIVILLLGKMMGSHHQSSMLSTMVHKQWGNMFMGFALARCVTYVMLYLSPPTSFLPARPPSELVSSFCLIAGGITFIVSNKDTVAALESYELDAMFTFVITVGFTALIMAWTVVNLALKGWAVRREHGVAFPKSNGSSTSLP